MHEVFCLVMFEFPNRYAYVYVLVISSLSSREGGKGGGGFVLCSCKIPIGRNLEYFLLLGCSSGNLF